MPSPHDTIDWSFDPVQDYQDRDDIAIALAESQARAEQEIAEAALDALLEQGGVL